MGAAKGNKYSQIYDEKELIRLGESIMDFAENERAAHFATWARKQNKTKSWINWLADTYPLFAEAYENAKELMAAKLLNSSIYQDDPKFNATHAMSYLPIYDKDLKTFIEWKIEISKQPLIPEEQNKCAFNEWKEQQKNHSGES